MTTPKNLFEVELAGVSVKLRTSHDEDTVNRLVSLVDEKIRQAMPVSGTGSFQNAVILAALNLAEEKEELKSAAREKMSHLETKLDRISSTLESSRIQRAGLRDC